VADGAWRHPDRVGRAAHVALEPRSGPRGGRVRRARED